MIDRLEALEQQRECCCCRFLHYASLRHTNSSYGTSRKAYDGGLLDCSGKGKMGADEDAGIGRVKGHAKLGYWGEQFVIAYTQLDCIALCCCCAACRARCDIASFYSRHIERQFPTKQQTRLPYYGWKKWTKVKKNEENVTATTAIELLLLLAMARRNKL